VVSSVLRSDGESLKPGKIGCFPLGEFPLGEWHPRSELPGSTSHTYATPCGIASSRSNSSVGKKHADDAMQRGFSVYITRWYHQSHTVLQAMLQEEA
jgi:hypothetical protein